MKKSPHDFTRRWFWSEVLKEAERDILLREPNLREECESYFIKLSEELATHRILRTMERISFECSGMDRNEKFCYVVTKFNAKETWNNGGKRTNSR